MYQKYFNSEIRSLNNLQSTLIKNAYFRMICIFCVFSENLRCSQHFDIDDAKRGIMNSVRKDYQQDGE